MEMIKVRRQEHAKCEAILHRLDSEIAAAGFCPIPISILVCFMSASVPGHASCND